MQRDLLLVREMIDAADQARALVAGRTASEVDEDRQRRDALLWNFAVLGEAANLVSEDTKSRFPEVPWRSPARLRNRVVHAYWSIDIGILHTTATEQLGNWATSHCNFAASRRSCSSMTRPSRDRSILGSDFLLAVAGPP